MITRMAAIQALRDLLTEVEYVIQSETIPATWLDRKNPDSAIVKARELIGEEVFDE